MRKAAVMATCLLGLAAAIYAADPQDRKDQKDPKQQAPAETDKATKKGQPSSSAAGMVVFVDPVTGQIRQPTASEIGALVGPSTSVTIAPAELTTFQGLGRAVGVQLPDSSHMFMVAGKTPDGKLATECVEDAKVAGLLVRSGDHPKEGEAQKAKTPTNVK